ncbi:MAG: FAD binding domain-containing protein [Candidatus Tectomicrobia bacterium]|uniref:FAD binding domain-containing protein n=1 Tax=Tectimicrobiota bacterium TaxID=2528274 RepID=A0A933GMZ1_UNCTE|nr:FAD binding domain-containing protein [Candidatus Tectomicrobia bacterium]
MSSALVALQAKVQIVGAKGTKTTLLEDFHVPPNRDVHRETILNSNEIVMEILIPGMEEGAKSSYRKVEARGSWDFALAGVALVMQFRTGRVVQVRIVLTGAVPVPWRSREMEEALTGRQLNAETIAKAAETIMKNAQPLGKNG